MSTKADNMTDYKFYLKQFTTTTDPDEKTKAGLALAKMIADNRLTVRVADGVWHYTAASSYKNKCEVCNTYYNKGEPAFYRDAPKGAMHAHCASDEVKASSPEYKRLNKTNGDTYETQED